MLRQRLWCRSSIGLRLSSTSINRANYSEWWSWWYTWSWIIYCPTLSTEGPTPGETRGYVKGHGTRKWSATAFTSKKAGVTGLLLRINPMLINYHCIAHRLALVTSQAAKDMAYIAKYQGTLTSIFYYFKASAVHTDALNPLTSRPECMPGSRYTGVGVLFFVIWSWNC